MVAPIPALSRPPPAAGAIRHRVLRLPVADSVTHPIAGLERHPVGPGLARLRDAPGLAPTRAASAARPVAARTDLGAQFHGPLRRRVGDRHMPVDGTAATRALSPDLLRHLVVGPCLVVAGDIHPRLRPLHLDGVVIRPSLARAVRQGGTFHEKEAIRGLRLAGANCFMMASAVMPSDLTCMHERFTGMHLLN